MQEHFSALAAAAVAEACRKLWGCAELLLASAHGAKKDQAMNVCHWLMTIFLLLLLQVLF